MESRGDSAAGLCRSSKLGKATTYSDDMEIHQQQEQHHSHSQQQAHIHKQQEQSHHDSHPQRFCLQPAEIYEHVAAGGEAKHRNSWMREIVLGFMAGAFISFGFATCMIAAGQINPESRHDNPGMFNLLFGAYGFPVGLSMCVINGASLFTSNIAYMMAAFIERKSTPLQSLWVVWLSYFSNLAGCLFLMQLMSSGDVFLHREAFTIELALKKCSYSFGATLTKGILCNWLVCMAVWQGNAAQDICGKLLGIWFPISAFVTSGYEHSIANMFVIPLAMRLGAPISVHTFVVKNLIPATIGNLIGGAIFVAMAFGMSYGSWEKSINAAAARVYSRAGAPDCGLVAFGAANVPVRKGDQSSNTSNTSKSRSGVSPSGSDSSLATHVAVMNLVANNAALKSSAPHPTAV